MIKLDEFQPAYIADCQALSLFIPLHHPECLVLVGSYDGRNCAVGLTGMWNNQCFLSKSEEHLTGVSVSKIYLEIDEKSAFDPRSMRPPFGALYSQEGNIFIQSSFSNKFPGNFTRVLLIDNLPPSPINVGFSRWNICIGSGHDKRILHEAIVEMPQH